MTVDELRQRAARTLRAYDGPLTAELVQRPGEFGLGRLPQRLVPDTAATTVCGFCSTGCGLTVHMKDGHAVNVTPTADHPVNAGMACPKGWEALAPLRADDRATTPYLRRPDGSLEAAEWDTALRTMCERFKRIQQRYGPDSLAFLSTGQIPTEEMALLGAVAKLGMGIRHGDGNTRQCMATSVVAYKESFGFDAPPFTYADFEESDVIVLVGANPCIAHPILWQRICRNRRDPAIVAIDPRRTETAAAARHHLALRPRSDLVLLYGLARLIIEHGWVDEAFVRDHTEGFESFSAHVERFTPVYVERRCGIRRAQLEELAELVGTRERVSLWWTMGVNQGHEAVRTAQAIINIALMTGNIGRPGTGANSITGQTNAMGSRLFSNTTSLFGGRSFTDPGDRRDVARILDVPAECIPSTNSWAYDEIVEGIRDGRIKGLWVIATNPSHSWIDRERFDEDVLGKLEFLVVQDMYHTTETARRADLVLPAAGAGEKEGTVINSERRIGSYKKVARAPGQALADFHIFRLVAEYWGCAEMLERWRSPEDVFEILKDLSRGRACDFSGIDGYELLEACGGVQWPYPHGATGPPESERRLFEDGRFFRPNGRALFCFEQPRPTPEPTDSVYPFTLITGRGTSAQWHTNTRTAKSAVLRTLYPAEAYVEINRADARDLGVTEGDLVAVRSRRGEALVQARVADRVARGQVFMPMHYEGTNRLTLAAFDPYSRQPSYKACAVRLVRTSEPDGRRSAHSSSHGS